MCGHARLDEHLDLKPYYDISGGALTRSNMDALITLIVHKLFLGTLKYVDI